MRHYTSRNPYRESPSDSAASILAEHEWKVLYCFVHKTTQLPDQPPTLRERMEDLYELREAVKRNNGKPGIHWEKVKKELDLD